MVGMMSLMTSGLAGYAVSAALGDSLSLMANYFVSTLVSGAVYIATLQYLRHLRGD